MLCRSHNQLEAERVFGKAFMKRKRKPNLLVRDGVRRSNEFVSGFGHPRRRGSSCPAGGTNAGDESRRSARGASDRVASVRQMSNV
jgi:hypothetical protein